MKLIDKSALVAEIEKQQRRLCTLGQSNEVELRKNVAIQNGVYCSLLSFLDTLEVKEIKNIWHIISETDLPKVGEHICCIKNGNILSGEYRANKFYGKVCDGYDNPIEKGDKWCRLYDLLNTLEVKEVDLKKEYK